MNEGMGRHRLGSQIPQEPQAPERLQAPQAPETFRAPERLQAPVPVPAAPAYGPRGPSAVRLVWVYPDLLSTYGDRGNLLTLARRARLRGIPVEIAEVNSDQQVPADGDIYLLGGGEDLPQVLAARRLAAGGGPPGGRGRGAGGVAGCGGAP